MSTSFTQIGVDLHLRNSEIREAFSRLIKYHDLYEKHCFCFFVDGLDEYEETRQEDYKAMVDLLCGWTEAAPNDVKICVSSREYNVFLNSLSADKRLRLHDLTGGDMKRYIRNKLGRLDDKVASDLIDTILTKASGIFLWVVLVVKSLRERLEETQELSILKREIDTLPDELEDLFRYLLNTVSKSARVTAYKTFAMLEALDCISRKPPDLSLFAYSFLEYYAKNPEFAIQTPFQYASISPDAKKSRIGQARKTLTGSTKGLVEAVNGSVKHVHRSIPEFLKNQEVRDEMVCHLQNFEAADAVSQLLVAELRVQAYMSSTFDRSHCSYMVCCIVQIRAKFGADCAPYSFLESLGSVLIEHGGPDVTQYPVKGLTIEGRILEFPSSAGIFSIQYREPAQYHIRGYIVISPLYISALLGLEDYVTWKVRYDQSILDTDFKTAVLVSIMEQRLLFNYGGQKRSTQTLESLLERGLSPQAVIHTTTTESSIWADNDRTVWENFVLLVALHLRDDGYSRLNMQLVGRAFGKFLEYGADPSLWLSAIPRSSSVAGDKYKDNYERYLEMRVGRNDGKILGKLFWGAISVHSLFTKVGGISFRELVEYLDFDNKESLLGLIDRNIKQQEVRTEEGARQEEHSWERNAESTLMRGSPSELTETRSWRLNTWFTSINTSHIMTFGLGGSKSPTLLICTRVLTAI